MYDSAFCGVAFQRNFQILDCGNLYFFRKSLALKIFLQQYVQTVDDLFPRINKRISLFQKFNLGEVKKCKLLANCEASDAVCFFARGRERSNLNSEISLQWEKCWGGLDQCQNFPLIQKQQDIYSLIYGVVDQVAYLPPRTTYFMLPIIMAGFTFLESSGKT